MVGSWTRSQESRPLFRRLETPVSLHWGEAITAKDTKRDRKQKGGPQRMSLGSFMAAPEKVVLPTGPRERAEGEEERRGLGGGFKTYGGDRGTLCTVLHYIDCEPGVQGLIQGSEMDTSTSRHLRVAIVAQFDVHDVAVSPQSFLKQPLVVR